MSELLKKPYKITLWEDRYTTTMGGHTGQFLEEVCIATIGSNTMDTPIRAFNPTLIEDLNGSKTFTFQIYYRYWDEEDEEFKINPFTNLLVNERKVKLYLPDNKDDNNNGWYDFVIKQAQGNSENYIFTYSCKDLFVNELGKTGYEVELATELENNMGTIKELASSILEGTDWEEKDSETIVQRNKEALYLYQLPHEIDAVDMVTGNIISIPQNKWIYVFYSCVANHEIPIQFFYVSSEATTYDAAKAVYQIDKDGFIINSPNYQDASQQTNRIDPSNISQPSGYFGQKLVQSQRMKYIPAIGETCTVWSKGGIEYYCYTENEYASVSEIQDLLTNNTNFISTNCWSSGEDNTIISVGTYVGEDSFVEVENIAGKSPKNEYWYTERSDGTYLPTDDIEAQSGTTYYINKNTFNSLVVAGSGTTTIKNSGLFDNRAALSPKGFVIGEPYIFAIKTNDNSKIDSARVYAKYNTGGSPAVIMEFEDVIALSSDLDGYKKFKTTVGAGQDQNTISESIDYQDLIQNYGDIVFEITLNNMTSNSPLHIIDAKVFKERRDGNNRLLVPDLQSSENAVVKTRYNFFPVSTSLNTVYGKDYLPLSETRNDTSGYTKVMVNNYEKVTSITGSKSNRFNLIQNLCEAFECWAKFTIEHYENGKIKYDVINDNNVFRLSYHKYVTFKEYIGEDNPVGFRYGINLKSIQRSLVSDQIASKVIVQPNTNEFAPNGSCTIQQAVLNPTGENALYNFQYFINQGLLDETALNNDLYSTTNGGLGFFVNMRALNDMAMPYINELAEVGNTLNSLESKQTIYDTLLSEADKIQTDTINELSRAGYGGVSANDDVNEYIQKLARQRDSYNSAKLYYTTLADQNRRLLDQYRGRYNNLLGWLKNIETQKEKLNSDFHKKYFAFIQEGTWTSSDYWDPELYYQAANMVLYTSSFPQVSYTINVLELSQVEGFEPYKFKIADKTYIEDTEFFGYDSKHRPYKEDIVISQIKQNFDDPSQNTITVQNYKTQFQDLFQRMAATSQTLQYNEGAYNRAAGAVNADGTINSVLLQNSLEDNALIIRNARNQSVTWDDTGITISNFKNANEIVRLTSGGIVLTTDSGQTWTTGITGKGINADVITTGRLDTNRIRIFSSNMQTFEWNSKGISAFAQSNVNNVTQTDFSKFVRFDQYGLYGYSGSNNWDPDVETNGQVGINKVIRDSNFSLTWKGLSINVPNTQDINTVISIGDPSNPKFTVDKNGNVTMAGNINLEHGSITWGNSAPASTKVLYARDKITKPADSSSDTYNTYSLNDSSKIIKMEQIGDNGWSLRAGVISTSGLQEDAYQSTAEASNTYSVAKIFFSGYSSFTIGLIGNRTLLYYIMASTIDSESYPTSADDTNVAAYARNVSSGVVNSYSYSCSTDEHWIYIVHKQTSTANYPTSFVLPVTDNSSSYVWHRTYNKNFDKYASYSYDGGKTWTEPMAIGTDEKEIYNTLAATNGKQLGLFYTQDGQLKLNASYITTGTLDASEITVTNLNADNISAGTLDADYISLNGYGSISTFAISDTGYASMSAADIYASDIYGSNIYGATFMASDGTGAYSIMSSTGFDIYTGTSNKLSLGYVNASLYYPYVQIGAGSTETTPNDSGLIMKFKQGLWVGSSDVRDNDLGNTPTFVTGETEVNTGIFINFSNKTIKFYTNGSEMSISGGGSSITIPSTTALLRGNGSGGVQAGPSFGTSTTTYLRNDGTWNSPSTTATFG